MNTVTNAWLPIGHKLPDGAAAGRVYYSGEHWQILDTGNRSRALIFTEELARQWSSDGLLAREVLLPISFGQRHFSCITSSSPSLLAPVEDCHAPRTYEDALAFAQSMGATRAAAPKVRFAGGIFVEKYSRILPTYEREQLEPDDLLLGRWLSGGLPIPAGDIVSFMRTVTWLDRKSLREVLVAARIPFRDDGSTQKAFRERGNAVRESGATEGLKPGSRFELPGRADLESFLNDHIVDVVLNPDRYRALGIDKPPAIILNGPPGCGKTFAVERLIEFLNWPSFEIDAASIGSPYIHETGRRIAQVFTEAIDAAPAVMVIDEMEAFVGERVGGSHSHRVEELAEFLRRIPQATHAGVLVIGMTNRIDLIDSAILRRGRFDHILDVGFASAIEVEAMLQSMAHAIPKAPDVDFAALAQSLKGRPLSDVSFVFREAARLAAKAARGELAQVDLLSALENAPPRGGQSSSRIGF